MNFHRLSKQTGIAKSTLRHRYFTGLRGDALVGPIRIKRVDVAKLIELAPLGLRTREYCQRVNSSPSRLPDQLRKHGVYSVWQRARYQKCQTVGSKSVRTASAAGTTPSAKLEAPTAGGTSYGI
jgi:hypothetical protein